MCFCLRNRVQKKEGKRVAPDFPVPQPTDPLCQGWLTLLGDGVATYRLLWVWSLYTGKLYVTLSYGFLPCRTLTSFAATWASSISLLYQIAYENELPKASVSQPGHPSDLLIKEQKLNNCSCYC